MGREMDGVKLPITEEWAINNADKIKDWREEVWHRLPDFSIDFIQQFQDEIGLHDYFCYLCMDTSRYKHMWRIANMVNINHENKLIGNTPWELVVLYGNVEGMKVILQYNDSHDFAVARKMLRFKLNLASGKGYTRKDKRAFRKYKTCLSFLTRFEANKKCQKNTPKNGM